MRRNIDLYALVTSLTPHKKAQLFVLIDALLIVACFGLAALLFGEKFNDFLAVKNGAIVLTFLVALGSATSVLLGLPNIRLNAFETGGVKPAAMLTVILSVAGLAVNMVLDSPFAPATFTVFGMMFLIGVVTTRNLMRNVLLSVYRRANNRTRVIVYGAGQTGQQLAAALRTDDAVVVVAFVDDNPRLQSPERLGCAGFCAQPPKGTDCRKGRGSRCSGDALCHSCRSGPHRHAPAPDGV